MKEIGLGIRFNGYEYVYKEDTMDNLLDTLQCLVLDFCGCGCPCDSVNYVKEGLKLIHKLETDVWTQRDYKEKDKAYNKWSIEEKEYFGENGGDYFFYYVVDKLGLTEHGGSVPGWLTKDGKDFIKLAEIALDDENDEFEIMENYKV